MSAKEDILRLLNNKGVWRHLLPICGWSAKERGSELIEPIDLIKAIYIVDLDHVAKYWDDWEGLEDFVTQIKYRNGHVATYINRTHYLLEVFYAARNQAGEFIPIGHPTAAFDDVVAAARKSAVERDGSGADPSSRDFLYSACSLDPTLANALQDSGLQLDKLEAWVRPRMALPKETKSPE
jgi:hypothetical protein